MARTTAQDWEKWHQERQNFAERETGGFAKDLEALELHIMKLQDYAPKDKAGWTVSDALEVIDRLQHEHTRIKAFIGDLSNPSELSDAL